MAKGEYSNVYFGEQINLKQPIVIKQLQSLYPDPIQAKEQVEKFQADAQMLAALHHPSLVTVYDVFLAEELPVIVMEYVEGNNLERIGHLAPRPLSERRALEFGFQLLETLEFLHNQDPPIIVRGLQPSNVILDRKRRLRLIDFGLAKAMEDDGSGTRNIVKGLGEDGYAPLEQGAYARTDARTDLYSLGAILYFLLTKEIPPSATQRVVAPNDPLEDPRKTNQTISEQTWLAIQKCMSLRPEERPKTALEAGKLFPEMRRETKNRKRHCVDCLELLTQISIDEVEIDKCERCGGMWLDNGELEMLRNKVDSSERQAEELIKTLELPHEHPAVKAMEHKDSPEGRTIWWTITRLLRIKD